MQPSARNRESVIAEGEPFQPGRRDIDALVVGGAETGNLSLASRCVKETIICLTIALATGD
jgi:hypothetical protein